MTNPYYKIHGINFKLYEAIYILKAIDKKQYFLANVPASKYHHYEKLYNEAPKLKLCELYDGSHKEIYKRRIEHLIFVLNAFGLIKVIKNGTN